MPKQHVIWTDDAATVTVTGGVEYGDRTVVNVSLEKANREELLERVADGLTTLQGHMDGVDAELAAWAGYDAAQMKASLGNVVLPALRFAILAEKHLARLVANALDDVD